MVTLLELERSSTPSEIAAGLYEINKARSGASFYNGAALVTEAELRAAVAAMIYFTMVENAKQP